MSTIRYKTNLHRNYLAGNKGWDVWAGIREFIQNGRDAEISLGATLTVKHIPESNTLVIENDGATIPREALLIGGTTKANDRRQAGFYGEGAKIGLLVLTREGIRVTVRTGSETWVPAFDGDELVVDIRDGNALRNRVRVEIDGIEKEVWKAVREKFLFLDPREVTKVTTAHGDLITSPRHRGKVFVKGIFVQNRPELEYGYNFTQAELDRDRRVLDSYDVDNHIRMIWTDALGQDPSLGESFYDMLAAGKDDVRGIGDWTASLLPQAFLTEAAGKFAAKHGDSAVPVANLAESKDIEHLGAKGVIARPGLAAVLAQVLGSTETVKSELANEVTCHHAWGELAVQERGNLESAVALLEGFGGFSDLLAKVDVVDFRSKNLEGQHKDGRYLLARRVLKTRKGALEVLVHEVAHDHGADGDVGHVRAIENLWSAIVEGLRS